MADTTHPDRLSLVFFDFLAVFLFKILAFFGGCPCFLYKQGQDDQVQIWFWASGVKSNCVGQT